MDVAEPISPELDLAALELPNRLGDVVGHRPRLGVRHKATGAKGAPQLADGRHHVRRSDGHVEIQHAPRDLGGQVIGPDMVGSRLAGGCRSLALGEHRHPDVSARP